MENFLKTLALATLCFSASVFADPRPQTPEQMSGKTALQFLMDNNIRMGWNLGNTLDAVNDNRTLAIESFWISGRPLATQQLFNGVRQSGFDMVRIPCTWIGHIGPAPEFRVSEARLRRVAEVVNYARNAGFKAIIINIHHDGNYTEPHRGTWGFLDFATAVNNSEKRAEIQNQLAVVWAQIAEYFRNYGDYLIFETMNEVHSGNWGFNATPREQDILYEWNQAALNAIRATGDNNTTRFVAVPGLGSTEPETVIAAHARGRLLPNDGANGTDKLIVSAHYYHPWRYTVADISNQTPGQTLLHTWEQNERGHPAYAIGNLKTTFIDRGIAVYIGEWGAQTNIRSNMSAEIRNTHIEYIRTVATAAVANGIVPIYWDDGGNFRLLERSNGRANAGLWAQTLAAMFVF